MDNNCPHPDSYERGYATDPEGNDLVLMRCADCGARWAEGV